MAKHTGFLEYNRMDPPKRPVQERIKDYREVEQVLSLEDLQRQANRCMDCGVPSCHTYGCPLNNRIPDWNDMVYRGQWKKALDLLHSTNNFPEITGRICPAPCEAACTLSINQPAVTIRHIERQIIEKGFEMGWIHPESAPDRRNQRVAVIGSGPAGLAAAQQLARKGYEAVVFEKSDRIGGLLRYGIPDFKMEKWVLDRRIQQMEAEGVEFETEVDAGRDLSPRFMKRSFNAILVTAGATVPRDLKIPGRELNGIVFAMEYLTQQNQVLANEKISPDDVIDAQGKSVVVIGGGDTGADCVGTAKRQGAASVTQIELMPRPPDQRSVENPWPTWPKIIRTSSSHEEGCKRLWSIQTQKFIGERWIEKLACIKLEWSEADAQGGLSFQEISGSEFTLEADLVLLAAGFMHVEHGPIVKDFNLKLDQRGNIIVNDQFMTSTEGVFAAGDSVTGASLVVRAIDQGRKAAEGINQYLSN
ncbi:glutamate synthase subunit beta [bacterium]|nr:glutamate synthase subunit beta [bacterium]